MSDSGRVPVVDNPGEIESYLGWILSAIGVGLSVLTTAFMRIAGRIDRVEARIDKVEDQVIENRANVRHIQEMLMELKEANQVRHNEYMAAFNRLSDKIDANMAQQNERKN